IRESDKVVEVSGQAVEVVEGPVEETILRIAQDHHADMIAMPTAGRDGFLDALRGSTTERVLRRAVCPVLAVPASSTDARSRYGRNAVTGMQFVHAANPRQSLFQRCALTLVFVAGHTFPSSPK